METLECEQETTLEVIRATGSATRLPAIRGIEDSKKAYELLIAQVSQDDGLNVAALIAKVATTRYTGAEPVTTFLDGINDLHTQLSGRRLRPRRSQHTRLATRPPPQRPRRHRLSEKQEAVQQAALEKRASELLVQSRTPARVGCDGYLRARQDHLGPAPHAVDEFLAKEPTLDLVATLAKSIVSYTCWIVTRTHTHTCNPQPPTQNVSPKAKKVKQTKNFPKPPPR